MVYLEQMDPKTGLLDASGVGSKGSDLAASYASAKPFPHIVIDNFLPGEMLENCLLEFPSNSGAIGENDSARERLKFSYNPDQLSEIIRIMFYSFNSLPFLTILENITKINGLIPDPYFRGGGLHELKQGGYLGIHSDFNHHKTMDLERRINVLIYLNKDWKSEYGGQLELWDENMTKPVQTIIPLLNRCVIFNTTSNSNHGNPNLVNHPGNISRKSIALYYYTATWSAEMKEHTTRFRARPGFKDSVDWSNRFRELAKDCVPPILARKILSRKP